MADRISISTSADETSSLRAQIAELKAKLASVEAQGDLSARSDLYARRLQLAIDSAGLGVWDFDPLSGTLDWSERCKALFGLPADAEVTYETFLERLHPEDCLHTDTVVQKALNPNGSGEYRIEYRTLWPDGTERWLEATGQAIFAEVDGQRCAVRFIGTVYDITDRKNAQEALRITNERFAIVLKGSSIVVFNQDLDLRYTWIYNPALGYAPSEVIGKTDYDIFERPQDAAVSESIKREVIRTGISRRREVLIHHQGIDHFYDLQVEPLRDHDGVISGVTCSAIDVTERRQAEAALLRSEKLAALGRMAASVAHEINNPLAAVTNLLYLMRINIENQQLVSECLEQAEDEVKRVAYTVRQALGFSREMTVSARVEIPAILESALTVLRSRIIARGTQISKRYDGPLAIQAVPGELRQVFANILVNALDALASGGSIHLRARPLRSGSVRVSIADDGQGILPEQQARIFEPLYTTKEATGAGIGLWVVRQIVEKHGGSIRLRSRTSGKYRGTVFTVILPAIMPASS